MKPQLTVAELIAAMRRERRGDSLGISSDPESIQALYRNAKWTGPRPEDIGPNGLLREPVPEERWPYGLPHMHETCCRLFRVDGTYCDCAASAADDLAFGERP